MRRQRSTRFVARCADAFRSAARSPARSPPLPIRSPFRSPTPCDRTCRSDITSVTGNAGSASSSATRLKRTSLIFPAPPVRDRGHLRMKHSAPRHHVSFHARLRAQYSRQVLRLRAHKSRGGFVPIFCNPAAARHACIHAPFASHSIVMRKNTSGDALCVPRECCLFGCMTRYFFFAAFFAAFFAGAFLAAFLVAICLFSLFDGLHRVLQH